MPRTVGKSKSYPVSFKAILVLIPFLILILIEVALRLFHYGSEFDLLRETTIQGVRYYRINETVARRYFSGSEAVIPDARNDLFRVQKSEDTFRIFCLGGSSTAGWPFLYNATFPSLLRDRLAARFPELNFEVINFGISAVNSFTVLDMVEELIDYQPDLFVIYMGHNEFYGALGVASTRKIGNNRQFVKFYLKLNKLKLVQFLRTNILAVRQKMTVNREGATGKTLMQQMIGKKYIRYRGDDYNTALENFQQNLRDIVRCLQSKKITVVVGTAVSNLRDQEPFVSQFSIDFADTTAWQTLVEHGQERETIGDFSGAVNYYQKAAALDSMPAELQFRIATCYDQLGDTIRAKEHYLTARDLDALRFRCSSDFNDAIRSVCQQEEASFIDLEAKLAPNGLIGNELILEHLHPNVEGYFQIARRFAEAIEQDKIIRRSPGNELDNAELRRMAYITDLELEIANVRIKQLTSRWPFKQRVTLRDSIDSEPERLLRSTVNKVLYQNMLFNDAAYELANYFQSRNQHQQAEIYYRALIKIRPMNYYPYIYLGNVLLAQNKIDAAEQAYLNSIDRGPELPFAYAKLGLVYLSSNRPRHALDVLMEAKENEKNARQFGRSDRTNLSYLLATAYAQNHDFVAALNEVRAGLKISPHDQRLTALKQRVEMALLLEIERSKK